LTKTDRCEPALKGLVPQINRDTEYLPNFIRGSLTSPARAEDTTLSAAIAATGKAPSFFRNSRREDCSHFDELLLFLPPRFKVSIFHLQKNRK
jgi:hypothetical protein